MFGRSALLALTVLVTTGIVLLLLRQPRVAALFHQGIPIAQSGGSSSRRSVFS